MLQAKYFQGGVFIPKRNRGGRLLAKIPKHMATKVINNKMSAFTNLVCRGDATKIKEYLEDSENKIEDRQIFINERDKSGKNSLDFAAMLGREDAIRILIECGADTNYCTKTGM